MLCLQNQYTEEFVCHFLFGWDIYVNLKPIALSTRSRGGFGTEAEANQSDDLQIGTTYGRNPNAYPPFQCFSTSIDFSSMIPIYLVFFPWLWYDLPWFVRDLCEEKFRK